MGTRGNIGLILISFYQLHLPKMVQTYVMTLKIDQLLLSNNSVVWELEIALYGKFLPLMKVDNHQQHY